MRNFLNLELRTAKKKKKILTRTVASSYVLRRGHRTKQVCTCYVALLEKQKCFSELQHKLFKRTESLGSVEYSLLAQEEGQGLLSTMKVVTVSTRNVSLCPEIVVLHNMHYSNVAL